MMAGGFEGAKRLTLRVVRCVFLVLSHALTFVSVSNLTTNHVLGELVLGNECAD